MFRTSFIVMTTMLCLCSAEEAVPDITGLWVGTFAQTQADGVLRVPFSMVVTQQGNSILARTLEVQAFGTKPSVGLSADVKGMIDRDRVHLVKTYDGSGGQTNSVSYVLTLSSDKNTLQGEWVISREVNGPVDLKRYANASIIAGDKPALPRAAAQNPPVPGFTLAALAAEVEVMKAMLQARQKGKVVEFLKRYFEPGDLADPLKEAGSVEALAGLLLEHGKDKDMLADLNTLDFKRPPMKVVEGRSQEPEANQAIINEAQRTITFILKEFNVVAEYERPIQFRFVDGRWYLKVE